MKARALVGLRLTQDCMGIPAGARLTAVLVLGKEMWLIFASSAGGGGGGQEEPGDDEDSVIDLCSDPGEEDEAEAAVRCHFGMSGSLLLDGATPRSSRREALRCHFGERSLSVFCDGSTGGCGRADAAAARGAVAARAHLDVCAERFDAARAAGRLAAEGAATIAAALMDQRVSPGTGNIIKIEALHRARVAPTRVVRDLSPEAIGAVVREARAFARAWLSGRRPACRVYDRTACADCGGDVAIAKDSATAHRVHFHCPACCARPTAAEAAPRPPRKRPREAPEAPRLFVRDHSCGKPAEALRRVRKQNQNEGRLFFSCSRAGCRAKFAWADGAFPKCACAAAAVSRLRITKQGPNAGRWFFGCAKPRGPGNCGFFQWADAGALASLGPHLRPLT